MVRCSKVSYPSRARAERALGNIRRLGAKREHKPQRSYVCSLCGLWHLTSQAR